MQRYGVPGPTRVVFAARIILLVCCVLLGLAAGTEHLVALAAISGPLLLITLTGLRPLSPTMVRLSTLPEAIIWATGVLVTGAENSPLLPYLLAPAFAGGLLLGLEGVLVPVGAAAVGVLATARVLAEQRPYVHVASTLAEWVALALVVGMLAAWVNRLQERVPGEDSYLHAYRLLAQLRAVARRLPTGLDRRAVADGLLREVRGVVPAAAAGAVLARGHGDRLSVLATSGDKPISGLPDIAGDTVYSEAWASQRPAHRGSTVVLPLIAGDRTTGLIVLRLPDAATASMVGRSPVAPAVRDGALRLETALLFDELREVATVEERRRLAREIHDGIAQDLAAFGYELDALAHKARGSLETRHFADELVRVRGVLGRLVVDLRQSIFELRSDVGESPSLGTAVSDFARVIGSSSGLNIHLAVDEGPNRLPADTEAELLRIAQEAINNSRKHANAQNLWIRCVVAPPDAELIIEDDGVGAVVAREDSFGLKIMQERAQRLQASLEVAARTPNGTVVTCRLGQR